MKCSKLMNGYVCYGQSLQIWLKSDKGEIEVYLCPEDDSGHSSPRSSTSSSGDEGKGTSVSTYMDSKTGVSASGHSSRPSPPPYSSVVSVTTGNDSSSSSPVSRRQHYTRSASKKDSGNSTHVQNAEGQNVKCETETEPEDDGRCTYMSEDDDLGPMGGSGKSSVLMMTDEAVVTHGPPRNMSYAISYGSETDHSYCPTISHVGTSSSPTLPFLPLEPPLSEEDYTFALEESEGIADLFDDCILLPGDTA